MSDLVHDLVLDAARRWPEHRALVFKGASLSYAALADEMAALARGLVGLGLARGERVAVYLDKRIETVVGLFGAALAGGVFVPVNPLLRPPQVGYILRDCAVRVLITSTQRAADLATELAACPDLRHVIVVGEVALAAAVSG
ncbi:MAG: acyl-CoA ligase (AMP-forming), exosortase A system-associated, partial [Alphaproteobacteria bacterium]